MNTDESDENMDIRRVERNYLPGFLQGGGFEQQEGGGGADASFFGQQISRE